MSAETTHRISNPGTTRGRVLETACGYTTEDDLVDAIRRFADLKKMQRSLNSGAAMPAHLGGATEERTQ